MQVEKANRNQGVSGLLGGLFSFVGALAVAITLVSAPQARAQVDEGIEPALKSDLATEALLLDVTKANGRLVAVGEFGHIILSDDGGASWRQAEYVPTQVTLTSVYFPSDKVGYAAGHDAVILRTKDGGENWEMIYRDFDSETPVLTMMFDSETHGMVMGAFGLVLETKDGGDTWEQRPLSAEIEDDYHLNKIFETKDGTLIVAAEFGTVYRSTDGGATFESIQTPYEGSFWGGLGLDDGSILIYGMRGNAYRSTDGGDSWQKVATDTDRSLGGSTVLSDGRIVLVGLSGVVAISNDKGKTFSAVIRPDRIGNSAVAEGPDNNLILFGEDGVLYHDLSAGS